MDYDEDPNYLDLDDIFAQTQTVEAQFLLDIPGLEFLSSSNTEEIKQGTEIMLPFWMAKVLYTYSMIDIKLPRAYTPDFIETLSAEADVVDLHKVGPDYYRFGKLLLGLKREKGNNLEVYMPDGQRNKFRREEGQTLENRRQIQHSLIDTFHKRRHKLLDYSTTSSARDVHHDYCSFVTRLDSMEKRLFQIARRQVEEIDKWKSRKIELISNNLIATRLAKRRKLESSIKSIADV